mgnify:CR=1 FL=1
MTAKNEELIELLKSKGAILRAIDHKSPSYHYGNNHYLTYNFQSEFQLRFGRKTKQY